MSVETERRFQSINKCWICNKLFTDEDKKYEIMIIQQENIDFMLIQIVILIFNSSCNIL